MKEVLRDILSLWKWILGLSIFGGFTLYLHHMFMSGVNPFISNAFVLIVFLSIIYLIYKIILKRKEFFSKSILAIIISVLLIYFISNIIVETLLNVLL